MKNSLYQVQMRLSQSSSQLINSISRFLQKLLKYFNGTAISTLFVILASGVFPFILIWNMNDLEFIL